MLDWIRKNLNWKTVSGFVLLILAVILGSNLKEAQVKKKAKKIREELDKVDGHVKEAHQVVGKGEQVVADSVKVLEKADKALEESRKVVAEADGVVRASEDKLDKLQAVRVEEEAKAEARKKRAAAAKSRRDKLTKGTLVVWIALAVLMFSHSVWAAESKVPEEYGVLLQSYLEAVDLVDEYKALYEESEKSNEVLLAQLKSDEEEIQLLQSQIKALQASVVSLQEVVASLKSTVVIQNGQIEASNAVIKGLTEDISRMKNTIEELLMEIMQLVRRRPFGVAGGVEAKYPIAGQGGLETSVYARAEIRW